MRGSCWGRLVVKALNCQHSKSALPKARNAEVAENFRRGRREILLDIEIKGSWLACHVHAPGQTLCFGRARQ
jgi:hypothetical protein